MTDDVLTFKQLREVRQQEKSDDTLQELDDGFVGKAKTYLERKKRTSTGISTEYINAKHTVEDILDTRRKKLLRLAFLSTKTDLRVDNLLPEEEEFFEALIDLIGEYADRMDARVFPDGEDTINMDATEGATEDELNSKDEGESDRRNAKELHDGGSIDQARGEAKNDDKADRQESDGGGGAEEEAGEPSSTGEVLFDGAEASNSKSNDMKRLCFLEDVGSFVGADMDSYGPFVEGEEARVPEENAAVLVDDGVAEFC